MVPRRHQASERRAEMGADETIRQVRDEVVAHKRAREREKKRD
jgi:hypothetical protein